MIISRCCSGFGCCAICCLPLRHHSTVVPHLGSCSPTIQRIILLACLTGQMGGHISCFVSAKHFETVGWKVPLLLLLIEVISWLSPNSLPYWEGRYLGEVLSLEEKEVLSRCVPGGPTSEGRCELCLLWPHRRPSQGLQPSAMAFPALPWLLG